MIAKVRAPRVPTLGERVDDLHVVRIGQSVASLRDGDPFECRDLVVGTEARRLERVRIHFRRPVIDDLVSAALNLVVHLTEWCAEPDRESGLLRDLADRRLGEQLARVDFALGQRDVLVLGPVHQQDADLAADHSPAHCSCGEDGGRIRHRSMPIRRRDEISLMSTSWLSASGVPSSASEWCSQVPSNSHQDAVVSARSRSKM